MVGAEDVEEAVDEAGQVHLVGGQSGGDVVVVDEHPRFGSEAISAGEIRAM